MPGVFISTTRTEAAKACRELDSDAKPEMPVYVCLVYSRLAILASQADSLGLGQGQAVCCPFAHHGSALLHNRSSLVCGLDVIFIDM